MKEEILLTDDMPLDLVAFNPDDALLQNKDVIKEWRLDCQRFLKLLDKAPATTLHYKVGQTEFDYVPIGSIETGLDKMFFGLWSDSMPFEPKTVANEIICTCVIKFFHPIAKIWLERSGIGAAQIRFKKESDITDIRNKLANALQMDAPHAYAEAFKNAAQKIATMFGKGLRRDYTEDYQGIIPNEKKENKTEFNIKVKELLELVDKLPNADQAYYKDIYLGKKKSGELTLAIIDDMIANVKKELK